jgi:hypothetical protein
MATTTNQAALTTNSSNAAIAAALRQHVQQHATGEMLQHALMDVRNAKANGHRGALLALAHKWNMQIPAPVPIADDNVRAYAMAAARAQLRVSAALVGVQQLANSWNQRIADAVDTDCIANGAVDALNRLADALEALAPAPR